MPRNWYDAEVLEIREEATQTKSFKMKLAGEPAFSFRAGQFVTFDLPLGEKRLDRWRSYSIASAPTEDGELELCISRLKGGKGSGYFFDEVQVGSTLKCKGPEGVFLLPETSDQHIVMICTGTGVAPFRAMLKDALTKGDQRTFHLIFGCRQKEDILYHQEFREMVTSFPDKFTYDVCLSREETGEHHHGYVHQVYEKAYQERQDVTFMLCGWTNMVDEAKTRLTGQMGVSPARVISEVYG